MSGDDLHLPLEICSQILTKLPVKSVLRCRSVCKTWYSLISSPNFISTHAVQIPNRNRVLVHRCERSTGLCKLSSHDDSFVESREHDDLPEEILNPGFDIVGSCDGLVCLSNRDMNNVDTIHSLLIWNPSIRKLVELPSRSSSSSANVRYLLGFGFDSQSSDYKVLRVVYQELGDLAPVVSEIVDLRNGVWRSLIPSMTPSHFEAPHSRSCVYLSEAFHWMANEFSSDCFLLSFDLSSEVFLEMGMPGGLEFKDSDDYAQVLPINGLLSVALLSRQLQGGGDHQDWCTAWSMKEYGVTESWTKLFRIELPYSRALPTLLGFREKGEVFLLDFGSNDGGVILVLYNPESKESKALLPTNELIFNVGFYTETLALL